MYRDWELGRVDDLEHRAAEWTTGEAATATILSAATPDDDYHFVFRNFGAGAALCMYPLPSVANFLVGAPDARLVPLQFFALSSELLATVSQRVAEVFAANARLSGGTYDIGFGHEASVRINRILAKKLRLPYERYVSTHERYGNTVSASVPLGMSLALEEGRLKRGDRGSWCWSVPPGSPSAWPRSRSDRRYARGRTFPRTHSTTSSIVEPGVNTFATPALASVG